MYDCKICTNGFVEFTLYNCWNNKSITIPIVKNVLQTTNNNNIRLCGLSKSIYLDCALESDVRSMG